MMEARDGGIWLSRAAALTSAAQRYRLWFGVGPRALLRGDAAGPAGSCLPASRDVVVLADANRAVASDGPAFRRAARGIGAHPVAAGQVSPARVRALLGVAVVPLLIALALIPLTPAEAQAPARETPAGPQAASAAAPLGLDAVEWQKLSARQRDALKPLRDEWARLGPQSQQEWLRMAERLPSMPREERMRIEARMTDWARMTPAQRGQARLRFQEAKQLPPSDRRSRWEEYQTLSADEKNELAARAAAVRARRAAEASGGSSGPQSRAQRAAANTAHGGNAKSNIVPNPTLAGAVRQVSPTLVQAAPGATTTLITRRPAPPAHQHTGLPKIAATPEFVQGSTLLPKRGAQGAAIEAPRTGRTEPNHSAEPAMPRALPVEPAASAVPTPGP